jgi:hypothetical protein
VGRPRRARYHGRRVVQLAVDGFAGGLSAVRRSGRTLSVLLRCSCSAPTRLHGVAMVSGIDPSCHERSRRRLRCPCGMDGLLEQLNRGNRRSALVT